MRASLHQTRLARSLNGDQGNSPSLRGIFTNRGGDESKPRSRGRKADPKSSNYKWRPDMLRFVLVNVRTPRADVHCAFAAPRSRQVTFGKSTPDSTIAAAAVSSVIPGWDSLCSNTVAELCDEVRSLPRASPLDRPALLAHAILLAGLQSSVSATS